MNRPVFHIMAILILMYFLAVPAPSFAKGVVLNFSDVDISTMVKFISDLTGKNFVMDDRVKGKISVYSPAKLSPDEAFNLFTSVLELKGFTVIQAGKVYKIVPTAGARQSGVKVVSGKERPPVNETYIARLIPLEHISGQEAVTFLQPVISKDGHISSFGPANMLLVVDSVLNIQKVLGILSLIDTDQRREGAELVFLRHASAENVAKLLREWLAGRDSGPKAPGQPTGAGGGVLADSRLNALVIFGREGEKEELKRLISLVDVPSPEAGGKVNVYYLENADAVEMAKVLDSVIKGTPLTTAAQQAGSPVVQPQFEAGKVAVTPDKSSNSLVIMASPADYQNLVQVIRKLDKRRRQVFVKAVIAEVSLDRLKEIGVQWGLMAGASDGTATVVGQYDPQNTFSQLLTTVQSMKNAGITIPDLTGTAANFAAVLKALDSKGAVNVLSTPNIMTSDNREAEIFVGENVPFLTSTSTTGTIATQSVERKDTGITLRITPQISEGEYVKLDIYQEISAVKDNRGQATDLVTTKRSAKTSVVVKDSDTVVIGGLIQDRETESVNRIPLLGDIPLLGWLFKTKSARREKTNLMIVLTPRIIRGAEEMTEVSRAQKERFGGAARSDEPFSLKAVNGDWGLGTGDREN